MLLISRDKSTRTPKIACSYDNIQQRGYLWCYIWIDQEVVVCKSMYTVLSANQKAFPQDASVILHAHILHNTIKVQGRKMLLKKFSTVYLTVQNAFLTNHLSFRNN